MKHFFAVDLGATSGRTILGILEDSESPKGSRVQEVQEVQEVQGFKSSRIEQRELTRFENPIIRTRGHCFWDIYHLFAEIIKGLQICASEGITPESIGIDTWGVDFVCIGQDGMPLRNPFSYRDPHTQNIQNEYFEEFKKFKSSESSDIRPFNSLSTPLQLRFNSASTIYDKTGIQFMDFNSLFQLYAMRRDGNSALEAAKKILFMPDCLSYMLTGRAVCEYTIASTSQLLNPRTKDLDEELLESVGLTRDMFGEMVMPGTVIGTLTPEVQRLTGLGPVPVVAVAGHDTASAVAAVPAKNEKFAYLSSGTWSLMGIETKEPIINDRSYELNFTNEGGVEGTTRFLKNICGMWLYERCRAEWTDAPKEHIKLQQEAMKEPANKSIINPDDPMFANPESMVEAIQTYCRNTGQPVPEGYAQICRCIFDSLVHRYKEIFGYLQEFAQFDIKTLHIIGGGSMNEYMNQMTADALGVEVVAGPAECTALGNIMMQIKSQQPTVNSQQPTAIWQMRQIIANSVETKTYKPNIL